ncbi:hypothetical protein AAC387_Pa07g0296 [Persea americana]
MSRRNELCRNFQRGSCQYGDRCRFIHTTQQQQKPNPSGFGPQSGSRFNQQQQKPNPFGFGTQSGSQFNQQQQKPNPFGFGARNSSQSKATSDIGTKYQNEVKPFENKWIRSSSVASGNPTPSRQSDNQPRVVHKCTDPESCKRQIAENLKQERPLWMLTCYGHSENRPCDIFGDISYEELRAVAYQDSNLGMSQQAIVERERNLLNSKLAEFENLLRNPYDLSSPGSPATATPFLATNRNATSMGVQNNMPIPVSSFSQLGSSINSVYNTRPVAPSNSAIGPSAPSPFQISSQAPGGFGINSSTFGNSGPFGSKQPTQLFGSALTSNNLNFNNGVMNVGSSLPSISQVSSPYFPSSASNLLTTLVNGAKDAANAAEYEKNTKVPEDIANQLKKEDMAIWLKKEWKRGEIPEEAPPDWLIEWLAKDSK